MLLRRTIESFFPQPFQDNSRTSADKISISRQSYDGKGADGQRIWTVLVVINNERGVEKTLTDPFTDTEYTACTNSPKGILLCNECSKTYFNKLVEDLGLEGVVCQGRPFRQISIHEELRNVTSEPSIYSLFWEVLENVHFWTSRAPTRVRLCRTWTFDAESEFITQPTRRLSLPISQKAECRILLVIARSYRRDGNERYRDYRPSLVLGPLLKIASICNQRGRLPRVRLDVVRPGTIDDLESKLEMHRERPYDIVHLDMHGKIDVGSALPAATPYLRFGRHYKENLAPFPKNKDPIAALMEDDSSLSDIEVDRVAALLREYRITKIALSACLSSYAQYDMLANMCHVFLSHGASHISAMSFQVLEKTAQIYYAAFYQALLVNGQSFLSAAAVGREALRAQPQSANALVPTSYHLRGRVSTGDFWPEYRLRLAWLPLVVAYCLRLGALLGIILGATPTLLPLYASILWSDLSEQCSGNGSLASISLAGIIWYGSVRWVHRLQCPLWLWIPHPLTIFHPRENLRLLSGHVEIEHLVLEDRLEFGASRGAIYLWNGDPDADLDRVIAGLCRVWVCTGFFDSIDVVPAMVFMSSLSYRQWWLRLRITRHKSDAPNSVGLGRRRLVVVTDFDHLYDSYHRQQDIATGKISDVALKDFEDALGRMAYFINHYGVSLSDSDSGDTDSDEISVAETDVDVDAGNVRSRNGLVIGKPYLIITGSFSDPKWRKLRWPTEEIINTIGRTIPHLHDVSPSQQ